MKHFAPYAVLLLFVLATINGYSQNPGNKPKQFEQFPAVIHCTEAELNKVFGLSSGQPVSFSFSDNFSFGGDVISQVAKYNTLTSATVKSPVYHNSLFSISRRINSDNSISYSGRILNRDYFDGYELKKTADGHYQLVKFETDKMIKDCRVN